MTRPTLRRLFTGGLVFLLLLAGMHFLFSSAPRVLHPSITSQTTVDDLVKLLLADTTGEQQETLLAAYADAMRPEEGTRALASASGRIKVLVAADGTWAHRDGFDAVWDREGEDVDLVLLLAGRGKSVGLFGSGGRGGRARAGRLVIGAGGNGGSGIFMGGQGGHGGNALGSPKAAVPARADGGAGGWSLIAGGSGGRTGNARTVSPGAPGLLGRCGDGGRGASGGEGGGE